MTGRPRGAADPPAAVGPSLPALFLVSLASIGFEIALTRYFAVAKWSEYGYWVISIVLAGFALSGVAVALARDWFARNGLRLLSWLPPLLLAAGATGYHFVTTNPFNPLLLQNQATLWPQLGLIGLYYVDLLPFFFLAGLFVSLSFVLGAPRVGRVYGFDLTGAGIGALVTLGLMWLVPPFRLVACLLLPLAAAAPLARRNRPAVIAVAAMTLLGGEALLLLDDAAGFNDFKAIYAPLHVPDSRVLATIASPRGWYMLLDDFTERVDTDVSNDAGQLGLPGPPRTFGLYRDGNRIAGLPKPVLPKPVLPKPVPARPGGLDVRYAGAALSALPYALLSRPRVLLAGASGGFRAEEALALGAATVAASEPEPVLREAIRHGLAGSPPLPPQPRIRLRASGPLALARAGAGRFDLVDISGDFLDAAPANATAFTAEAVAADLRATGPGGLVSIPVSIREFPAYASRMLATVRAALLAVGAPDPGRNVLVYRSAWTVRILASAAPLEPARIAAARAWCDARSFDVSYFPGIDVAAARAGIYNDLPSVSFEAGQVTSSGEGAHDAIADDAGAVLAGQPTESTRSFDLTPITLDRPAFYAVLRLSGLATILRRLELLPQQEVAPLVNLAVLAQAAVIALAVLVAPLLAGRRVRRPGGGTATAIVYFAALGLGFLFIEIVAIERASVYLDDRTSGFALVLTSMLIFSGLGALLADRLLPSARRAMAVASLAILAWGALMLAALQPAILASLSWPWAVRALLVVLAVAPVSVALGLPFPLGLARVAASPGFLPWAWGLNGAFSVVSTPLANLVAQQFGFSRVLAAALLLYVVAFATFPTARNTSWQIPRRADAPHALGLRRGADRPRRAGWPRPRRGQCRRGLDPARLSGGDGPVRPPGQPDRRAVRRHPGAAAGGAAADRKLFEIASGQRRPGGAGGLPRGAARVFPLPVRPAPRHARRFVRGQPEALGARLRLGAVGLFGAGLHDPGLPAAPGSGHAGDRHRQRLPERGAVAHRRARLFDRDHLAAGSCGGPDLGAARLRQRSGPGRRRLLRLAGGRRRLRCHHRHLCGAICAARPVQAAQARRPHDHSDRPAVQARPVPVHLHQGRRRQGPLAQGCRRVLHPDDRRHDEAAGAAEGVTLRPG